jgi:hypothetical protein
MFPGAIFPKAAYPDTPRSIQNTVLKNRPYKEAFFIVLFSAGGALSVSCIHVNKLLVYTRIEVQEEENVSQ